MTLLTNSFYQICMHSNRCGILSGWKTDNNRAILLSHWQTTSISLIATNPCLFHVHMAKEFKWNFNGEHFRLICLSNQWTSPNMNIQMWNYSILNRSMDFRELFSRTEKKLCSNKECLKHRAKLLHQFHWNSSKFCSNHTFVLQVQWAHLFFIHHFSTIFFFFVCAAAENTQRKQSMNFPLPYSAVQTHAYDTCLHCIRSWHENRLFRHTCTQSQDKWKMNTCGYVACKVSSWEFHPDCQCATFPFIMPLLLLCASKNRQRNNHFHSSYCVVPFVWRKKKPMPSDFRLRTFHEQIVIFMI